MFSKTFIFQNTDHQLQARVSLFALIVIKIVGWCTEWIRILPRIQIVKFVLDMSHAFTLNLVPDET